MTINSEIEHLFRRLQLTTVHWSTFFGEKNSFDHVHWYFHSVLESTILFDRYFKFITLTGFSPISLLWCKLACEVSETVFPGYWYFFQTLTMISRLMLVYEILHMSCYCCNRESTLNALIMECIDGVKIFYCFGDFILFRRLHGLTENVNRLPTL